uniref:Cell cycle regulator of NHEJ n=1 Tax=Sus scrofa TaxID=9823 RepID=A0A8D1RSC1_PIG
MEALKSENKKRVLPTWMTAQGAEKKTTKRRRADLVPTAAARGSSGQGPPGESTSCHEDRVLHE